MPSYIDCRECNPVNITPPTEKSNCKSCPSDNSAIIKKRIQNKVRISSSLYTMNLGASNPDRDVGKKSIKKNDSYARYLAKKKNKCVCLN